MCISPSPNKYLLFIPGFPFAGEHIAGIVNHRSIAQPLRCLAGAVLVADHFSCLAGSRLIGVIGR